MRATVPLDRQESERATRPSRVTVLLPLPDEPPEEVQGYVSGTFWLIPARVREVSESGMAFRCRVDFSQMRILLSVDLPGRAGFVEARVLSREPGRSRDWHYDVAYDRWLDEEAR